MKKFESIRLIAIDVDGVILNDTYSPAIQSFIEKHGGTYTPELERLVWGSPHIAGGHIMSLACKLPWSAQQTINEFFNHHDSYLDMHPLHILDGVETFLKLINEYNIKITSYGGRTQKYIFDSYMSSLKMYFDKNNPYIDTNSIRPGVMEITKEIFQLEYNQVLFIDDINRMAEVAKYFNAGFAGTPVTRYQARQMQETGVKYIFNGLSEFKEENLLEIDRRLLQNNLW